MNLPKDVYEYLMNFADDRTILSMLSTNKQFRNEDFFRRVMKRKYPNTIRFKKDEQTWKQFYIETAYYVNKIYELIGYQYSKTAEKSPKDYYKFIKIHTNDFINLLRDGIVAKDIDFVKFLIGKGAYANDWIITAAAESSPEILDYLRSKGGDIRKFNDEPLIYAVFNNNLDNVKYLIDHGANIHAENDDPIFTAAKYGHFEILKYLIEKGANVDKNKLITEALKENHQDVVNYLKTL